MVRINFNLSPVITQIVTANPSRNHDHTVNYIEAGKLQRKYLDSRVRATYGNFWNHFLQQQLAVTSHTTN